MQSPDFRLVTETKLANVGVTLWKAATSYKQGQAVLSPTGVVVAALADFTSNSSYDATKWSAPNIGVTDYDALTNKPTLGTAASQPSTAFDAAGAASAAQSTAAADASTKDAALAASVAATYVPLTAPQRAVGNAFGLYLPTDTAFGAKGDGTTDDTVAFRACFAAAAAAGRPVYISATPTGYLITDTITSTVRGIYGSANRMGSQGTVIIWRPATVTDLKPCFDIADGMYGGGIVRDVTVQGSVDYRSNLSSYVTASALPAYSAFAAGVAAFRTSGSVQPIFQNVSTTGVKCSVVLDSTNGHVSFYDVSFSGLFGVYCRANSEDYYFHGGTLSSAWANIIFGTQLIAGHYGGMNIKADRVHIGFAPYSIYQVQDSATPPAAPLGLQGQFRNCRFEQIGEAAIQLLPESVSDGLSIDSLGFSWSDPSSTGWNNSLPTAIMPATSRQQYAMKLGIVHDLEIDRKGSPVLLTPSPYATVAGAAALYVSYLRDGVLSLEGVTPGAVNVASKDLQMSTTRNRGVSDTDIFARSSHGVRGGNLLLDPELASSYSSLFNCTVSIVTLAAAIAATGQTPSEDQLTYLGGYSAPVLKITPTGTGPGVTLSITSAPVATERPLTLGFVWFGATMRARIATSTGGTYLADSTASSTGSWNRWVAQGYQAAAGSRSYQSVQLVNLDGTNPTYVAGLMLNEGSPRPYGRAKGAFARDGLALPSSTGGFQTFTADTLATAAIGYYAGDYYTATGVRSTATRPNGATTLLPIHVETTHTFTGLAVEVTTAGNAGAIARLGIYSDPGRTGRPTTLVADLGIVAADSTGVKTITGQSIALTPGVHYLAVNVQSATTTLPAFRAFTGPVRGAAIFNPSSSLANGSGYTQAASNQSTLPSTFAGSVTDTAILAALIG